MKGNFSFLLNDFDVIILAAGKFLKLIFICMNETKLSSNLRYGVIFK